MFGTLVGLRTAAVGVGAVLIAFAGVFAIAGVDLSWLRVLGVASFAAGVPVVLSSPPGWEKKLETETFPRLWFSPGAGLAVAGSLLAYLTSFLGLLRLGLEPPCSLSPGGRTACAPSVLFDTAVDALFSVMLVGASLALLAVGFGAARAPAGSWGYFLVGGGVLALVFVFASVPLGVGLLLLGIGWAWVAYVVWRHPESIT